MVKLKKIKTVDAILTSDWHLRETIPTCREDDFLQKQWEDVQFVSSLQSDFGCDVYHGGDLFHHWKPSPWLISKTLEYLPIRFRTVYGQHDLPQHNLDLSDKSGIHALRMAERVDVIGAHWGQKPRISNSFKIKGRRIAIWHKFNYVGKTPWPGCKDPKATSLIEKYRKFDLMLTGDNHQAFVIESDDGRLLVNPGNLTRQSAAQIDFKPRVYLWDAKMNEVEPVYIPIKGEKISRKHIEEKKEKENRINAFISNLETGELDFVKFEDNLSKFLNKNKVHKKVQKIIYKALEEKEK